jgi:hypothetical protein
MAQRVQFFRADAERKGKSPSQGSGEQEKSQTFPYEIPFLNSSAGEGD